MRGVAAVLVVLGVYLSPAELHAEPPSDAVAKAKEHYKNGVQLFDLGRYLDAVTEYELAFRLSDLPGFLFNIGQGYRLANRPREALAAYQGYLRRVPQGPQREEAEKHIAAVQQAIAAEEERAVAAQEEAALKLSAQRTPTNAATTDFVALPKAVPVRPLYKRAWFWGVLASGVVVVGAAVAIGIVFGSRTNIGQQELVYR